MHYIRSYYGVPAKVGGLIRFRDAKGVIVGASGPYLRVRLSSVPKILRVHPTWMMEYL